MYDIEYDLDDTTGLALDCMEGQWIDFDISMCTDYNGGFTMSAKADSEWPLENKHGIITESTITDSDSSTTAWRTVAIVEIPLCAILAVSALFLKRKKAKLNS